MKEFIQNVLKSFDTHSKGYSGRKLSALAIIVCVVAAHVKWMALGDFTQLISVLTIDFSFISVCLGMVTYESMKKNESTTQPNL